MKFLCYFFLCISLDLSGQALILTGNQQNILLGKYCRVFKDLDSSANTTSIMKLDPMKAFTVPKENNLNFDFGIASYWITFEVLNNSTETDFVLESNYVGLYDLRLYIKDGHSLKLIGENGLRMPHKPENSSIFFHFDVQIPYNTQQRYYLFFNVGQNGNSFTLPLKLFDEKTFDVHATSSNLMKGVLLGILSIYLLITISLHLILKRTETFWLFCVIFLSSGYLLLNQGILLNFHWVFFSNIYRILAGFLLIGGYSAFLLLFVSFMKTNGFVSKWFTVVYYFNFVRLSIFFLTLPSYVWENQYLQYFDEKSQYLSWIPPIIILCFSYLSWSHTRNKLFVLFPIIYLPFLIVATLLQMKSLGMISSDFSFSNLFVFCLPIDFTLFISYFTWKVVLFKIEHAKQELFIAKAKSDSLENLLRGQQEERRRIRLRLHDGLGILLASTRMRISKLAAKDASFISLDTEIAAAVNEIRQLSYDLDPQSLREGRLIESVKDTLGRAKTIAPNLQLNIEVEAGFDEDKISHPIKIACFYIAQELIFNTIKHANATLLMISIEISHQNTLLLQVIDDGKGIFLSKNNQSGIGIENIRARVEVVNGKFVMNQPSKGGLISRVEIPL